MASGPILLIESSTRNCSVGACFKGELIALKEESGEQFIHAEKLHLFVRDILSEIGKSEKLSAIAVSNGPGSYTGLRIGLSLAKGLAFGLNIPLITLSTLSVLFESYKMQNGIGEGQFYWPMLDARRMEVYTNQFNSEGVPLEKDRPMILDEELPSTQGVCFGDGAEKAKDLLLTNGFGIQEGIIPSASAMVHLASKAMENNDFADKAYAEPFYLKAFQTTQPKRKGV